MVMIDEAVNGEEEVSSAELAEKGSRIGLSPLVKIGGLFAF